MPLAKLLTLRVEARRRFAATQTEFLQEPPQRVPFLIALGGSVAVGKSTAARLVVRLLQSLRPDWRVQLVTTDGFLLPNAVLDERGSTRLRLAVAEARRRVAVHGGRSCALAGAGRRPAVAGL